MTFRRRPFRRGAFASGQRIARDPTHGAFIVPDGLGGSRRNYVISSAMRRPYRMGTFGGLGTRVLRVGAALTFPNVIRARMEITAWWWHSSSIFLTRVHPDGDRVPVRGAFPIKTGGLSRRNESENPRVAGGNLAGWHGVDGTAEPTATTEGPFPKGCDAAARFVADDHFRVSFSLPVVLTGVGRVDTVSVRVSGFADQLYPSTPHRQPAANLYPSPNLYPSANLFASTNQYPWVSLYPSTKLFPPPPIRARRTISWYDSGGYWISDTVHAVDRVDLLRAAGKFSVFPAVISPPQGALRGVMKVTVEGLARGAFVDATAHLSEPGVTEVRPFFDGSWTAGNWLGDTDRSPSVLSTPVSVSDGECPLDIPVRYEITSASLPGVRILTDPVSLDSRGVTWMTDPLSPEAPLPVIVTRDPQRKRALEQQVFPVAGRKHFVVRTEEVRHGPVGTLQFSVASEGEEKALLHLLESPMAKLIRTPADHTSWDPNTWMSLGDADETTPAERAAADLRTFDVPYTQVDRPAIVPAAPLPGAA